MVQPEITHIKIYLEFYRVDIFQGIYPSLNIIFGAIYNKMLSESR